MASGIRRALHPSLVVVLILAGAGFALARQTATAEAAPPGGGTPTAFVRVNQVGYVATAAKRASGKACTSTGMDGKATKWRCKAAKATGCSTPMRWAR